MSTKGTKITPLKKREEWKKEEGNQEIRTHKSPKLFLFSGEKASLKIGPFSQIPVN
jgi:hypothetical protein